MKKKKDSSLKTRIWDFTNNFNLTVKMQIKVICFISIKSNRVLDK